MKNLILLMIFFLITPHALARTTQASKFAEKQFCERNNIKKTVKIIVKTEHTQKYYGTTGTEVFREITYGWGDMKIPGQKKSRISYLVISGLKKVPLWSSVYISE